MIIKKITTGFVIQSYDTEKKKYIHQEFIAGDEVDYEDEEGNIVCPTTMLGEGEEFEPYLPFDMVQPEKPKSSKKSKKPKKKKK